MPSSEGRSRKGDSLLGVLAVRPLKRESGNRMQTDACLSSKNLLSRVRKPGKELQRMKIAMETEVKVLW